MPFKFPSFPTLSDRYSINPKYEVIIQRVLELSLQHCNRVCALRFDLRFPEQGIYQDPKVISRFIDSFKAHLRAWDNQRLGQHPIGFGYVWCRERHDSANWHYHVFFFFNKDAVCGFGSNTFGEENMYNRILSAWASAIGVPAAYANGLVYICKNGAYWLDRRSTDFDKQLALAMDRFSYLAKRETKDFDDGNRNFGSSQQLFLS